MLLAAYLPIAAQLRLGIGTPGQQVAGQQFLDLAERVCEVPRDSVRRSTRPTASSLAANSGCARMDLISEPNSSPSRCRA